jgi:hypothetical protein
MANQVDIKYLNKDFASLKADLIEYARAYYPTAYNDFTQASPGSMFIDMASYVGDVLSFYLDNQLQETFLQYAKQKGNLFTLAYMLGYRPKVTSAAIVNLDVYQQLPAVTVDGNTSPDFAFAMTIEQGMQVKSNVNSSVVFYTPQKVNFASSSSLDPTTIEVYEILNDINGDIIPKSYLLKKTVQALSGQVKTQTFTFSSPQRFATVNISDSSIITILSAKDSDGNTWYEVPYLAQDYILTPVANTSINYTNQVPYMIEKKLVPRRFTSRFRADGSLEIEFGPGMNYIASTPVSDSEFLPNPNNVSVGLTGGGLSTLSSSFDPTNFVTTQTYGLAPKNTSISFQYLVGGGASANVLSNQLTQIVSYTVTGDTTFQNTIVVNNPDPASGGGDGDTVDELRMNIAAEFPTQYRAVTQEDYLARTLSMPPQYGKISKAYITKDDATFNNYMQGDISQKDQVLVSLYVLGLDANNNIADPSPSLLQNLQTYLSDYRMMTDAINIKPGYVINIGCDFEIIIRPNYTSQDVIARCILTLQDFFNINNWKINEPIILGDIYSLLDVVEGVQTVKDVRIINKSGEANGYSRYSYDISAGSLNGVIYPSLDPSIFEVKFPNTDIQGRVVTM